jgi:hypothetical protein
MTYPPQYDPYQPPPDPRQFSAPPQPLPYQPYGAPPPGFPPPQPPKRRMGGWTIIGVGLLILFGLCGIGAALQNFSGRNDTASSSTDDQAAAGEATSRAKSKPKEKALAGLNTPVRDGKFEFTVTDVDCSKSALGNEYLNSKAQGKYCLVEVTVKNIGDAPQMFSGSTQKAYDAKGAEFTNDGGAEFYANDNNQTFLNEVNPGNHVKGKVVFDVPQSTTLTTLELHDSFFSGGVQVSLK